MKRTKKLLAMALALMMAFSCMAMPAMAAGEDEGIMPLGEHMQCLLCGRDIAIVIEPQYHYNEAYATTCSRSSTKHTHVPYQNHKVAVCICGQDYSYTLPQQYDKCML